MITQLRKRGSVAVRLSSLMMQHTTAGDLFCGAGGLSLGLQLAGCRVAFEADGDRRRRATESNFRQRTTYNRSSMERSGQAATCAVAPLGVWAR